MKIRTGLMMAGLLAAPAWAQAPAPPTGALSPPPAATTGLKPPAASPAAGTSTTAKPPVAGPTAGTTAPATGATAPAPGAAATPGPAAGAATGHVTVRVPTGASYTVYIAENASTMKSIQDSGQLDVPAGLKSYTIYVLDSRSGYAARKTVTAGAGASEVAFAGPDFKLLQKVRVTATGQGDQPIAQGIVTLTDGGKNNSSKVIQPTSAGVAEFDMVVSGPGKISVKPEGGSVTSKDLSLDLPPGNPALEVRISLPEVTATAPAPAASPGTAVAPSPATPGTEAPATAPPAAPTVAPAAPVAPAPLPAPAPAGGGWGSMLVSWIFLIGLLAAAYYFLRNKGITLDTLMKKLGVQPEAVAVGGGSLAGANHASGAASPGVPPPPPPIVADPNQCPFCGQMKDAAGGCACVVAPGSASAPPSAAAPAGSGPRLVGMAGAYLGHVFPLGGSVTLGREPTNGVALDRDSTTSRRHAQITVEGGSARLQDLGSSNGTFVNGAKITEAVLQPGDEISVGGTRFRYEV